MRRVPVLATDVIMRTTRQPNPSPPLNPTGSASWICPILLFTFGCFEIYFGCYGHDYYTQRKGWVHHEDGVKTGLFFFFLSGISVIWLAWYRRKSNRSKGETNNIDKK